MKSNSEEEEEEEEELEFYDLSALYIDYSSHYIHTLIVHRGKKGETEFGYRETWNSTTANPIHWTNSLHPHPMDDDGIGNRTRVFPLKV